MLETISSAARKLGIPEAALRALESRGAVPKFTRDASKRRLLTADDLEAVGRYLESRHSQTSL